MNNKIFINGGFPLLLYCPIPDINKKNIKERLFSSSIVHNINIKQILSNNKKTFILDPIKNVNDPLEIINNI